MSKMTTKNYNISNNTQKNFAYYIVRNEGKHIRNINVDNGGHPDDILYDLNEKWGVTAMIKGREEPRTDLRHKRFDLTLIGKESAIDLALNQFQIKGITLEEVIN